MIVHLRVSQIALLLTARDQELELRLTVFGHHRCTTLDAQRFLVRSILRAGALRLDDFGFDGLGAVLLSGLFRALHRRFRLGRRGNNGRCFLGSGYFYRLARRGRRALLGGGSGLVLACHI